jgi:hypothetical protein
MELACLQHPKVVNAAYFSPLSGSKLMTTCIDNRWAPVPQPSQPAAVKTCPAKATVKSSCCQSRRASPRRFLCLARMPC